MDNFEINNVTYIKVVRECPHCRKTGKKIPKTEWVHKDCGGLIYIGDDASLLCKKCGWTIPIQEARCNCPDHEDCSIANIELEQRDFGIFNDGEGLIPYDQVGIPWLRRFLQNYISI